MNPKDNKYSEDPNFNAICSEVAMNAAILCLQNDYPEGFVKFGLRSLELKEKVWDEVDAQKK